VHTNSVAKNIADRLGSISYMMHSPAVLDSKEIREIVENDSNTREIIKLSEKIDTALVGLSDIGADSTLIKTGSFSLDEFKYLDSLGIVGDVNLIFIDENEVDVENWKELCLKRINKTMIIKLRQGYLVKNVLGGKDEEEYDDPSQAYNEQQQRAIGNDGVLNALRPINFK